MTQIGYTKFCVSTNPNKEVKNRLIISANQLMFDMITNFYPIMVSFFQLLIVSAFTK